jgi:hypothetical protein
VLVDTSGHDVSRAASSASGGRGRLVDVQGRLELDRESLELRRISFAYVNLPRGPGGEVDSGLTEELKQDPEG